MKHKTTIGTSELRRRHVRGTFRDNAGQVVRFINNDHKQLLILSLDKPKQVV